MSMSEFNIKAAQFDLEPGPASPTFDFSKVEKVASYVEDSIQPVTPA